jgi:hypothetical protein
MTATHEQVEQEARCPHHGAGIKRISHSDDGTQYENGDRDRRFFVVYECKCRGVVVGYAGSPATLESTAPAWAQSERW